MSARLVHGWSLHGFDASILGNRALRVVVLPELGGKVHELVDKIADRDLLSHNPRTPPRRAPFGAHFDDWWSGGWDEIFPTGDVAHLHGEPLPYMGELWSVPWSAREDAAVDGAVAMTTTGLATIAAARLERRLELRGDEPVLRVSYPADEPRPAAAAVRLGDPPGVGRVAGTPDRPAGGEMLVGVSSDPSFGTPGTTYPWPQLTGPGVAEGGRDMRRVPPADAMVLGGH